MIFLRHHSPAGLQAGGRGDPGHDVGQGLGAEAPGRIPDRAAAARQRRSQVAVPVDADEQRPAAGTCQSRSIAAALGDFFGG